MNRLKMLVGFGAIGVAMILPPSALAGGPHIDPAGTLITGEGGALTIAAEGEPSVTCTSSNQLTGGLDAESSTTGEIKLDLHNCHWTIFGITKKCRSQFPLLNNTIEISPIRFHTVYTTAGTAKPGILLTFPTLKITCEGLPVPLELTGSVMGTITSPECGKSSQTGSLSFSATGLQQNQTQITGAGTMYDLQEKTEGSLWKTATLTLTIPLAFNKSITLTCI